jgi:hypothetical protein
VIDDSPDLVVEYVPPPKALPLSSSEKLPDEDDDLGLDSTSDQAPDAEQPTSLQDEI